MIIAYALQTAEFAKLANNDITGLPIANRFQTLLEAAIEYAQTEGRGASGFSCFSSTLSSSRNVNIRLVRPSDIRTNGSEASPNCYARFRAFATPHGQTLRIQKRGLTCDRFLHASRGTSLDPSLAWTNVPGSKLWQTSCITALAASWKPQDAQFRARKIAHRHCQNIQRISASQPRSPYAATGLANMQTFRSRNNNALHQFQTP